MGELLWSTIVNVGAGTQDGLAAKARAAYTRRPGRDLPLTLAVICGRSVGRPQHALQLAIEVGDNVHGWETAVAGEVDDGESIAQLTLPPDADMRVRWELAPDDPPTSWYWWPVVRLA